MVKMQSQKLVSFFRIYLIMVKFSRKFMN